MATTGANFLRIIFEIDKAINGENKTPIVIFLSCDAMIKTKTIYETLHLLYLL